jgi:beta-glucosidase
MASTVGTLGSDPDERARVTEEQMTDEERFSLVVSIGGFSRGVGRDKRYPDDIATTAGYTPGVPRLGVPALLSSDASMGVTNPGFPPDDQGATALPASIAVGASFNPQLAREGGAMIGREARIRGFNVQLAGGINLARDVHNGRNFEYYSEDPYLSAILGSEAVNGIQSQGVISLLKHYTLNCNETNRYWLDAIIEPVALRESDLLAFQIAIERSQPGSIMSSYNKVNGDYTGGNDWLLNEVPKGSWGYTGWVMSDWAATPSWEFALKGLDQKSGAQLDVMMWKAEAFTDRPRAAYILAPRGEGQLVAGLRPFHWLGRWRPSDRFIARRWASFISPRAKLWKTDDGPALRAGRAFARIPKPGCGYEGRIVALRDSRDRQEALQVAGIRP